MRELILLFQLFQPADLARFHEQRIAALQPGTPEAKQAHKDLGLFWLKNNNPAEAEVQLLQSLPDPEVAPFLAEAVAAQGHHARAEALFRECRTNPRCLSRLAQLAQARGDEKTNLELLAELVKNEPTPAHRNDYAQALQAAGKPKEAEALFRAALRDQKTNQPETAITQNNLATLLTSLERYAEAEPLQRQALATMQRTLGPRHVRTALAASNLADIVRARGREPEARMLYQQALTLFEELLPPNHAWTQEARQALAQRPPTR